MQRTMMEIAVDQTQNDIDGEKDSIIEWYNKCVLWYEDAPQELRRMLEDEKIVIDEEILKAVTSPEEKEELYTVDELYMHYLNEVYKKELKGE